MTENQRHLEAWKGIIDFSKVVLTFASAVTVAIIGYYVAKEVRPSFHSSVPLILLVLSVIFSLFGFGRGIVAIKTGESRKFGVLFCNLGAIFLIAGMLYAFFYPPEFNDNFIDSYTDALSEIDKSNLNVDKKRLKEVIYKGDTFTMKFDVTSGVTEITYDRKSKTITNIKNTP